MIVNTEINSPVYNADGITIDCSLNHPVFGWIPFTASPDDVEEHGRVLYQAIIDGQFGPIAPYVQ